jgi:hypothetical protein
MVSPMRFLLAFTSPVRRNLIDTAYWYLDLETIFVVTPKSKRAQACNAFRLTKMTLQLTHAALHIGDTRIINYIDTRLRSNGAIFLSSFLIEYLSLFKGRQSLKLGIES